MAKKDKKEKSRRPPNTAFRQQRLQAFEPVLTPKVTILTFLVIGLITAAIGAIIIWATTQVQEFRIDYTDCATSAPAGNDLAAMNDDLVYYKFKSSNTSFAPAWRREQNVSHAYRGNFAVNVTKCVIQFTTPEDIAAPVDFYYRLENFYQNHRRYVKSLYDKQLKGDSVSVSSVSSSDCSPLTTDAQGRAYYPCGLIANSVFNDTFSTPVLLNTETNGILNQTYNMTDQGITWSADSALYGPYPSDMDFDKFVPPPYWQKQYPGGKYSAEVPPPNLQEDRHFQTWMRTAALPTFSKLYMQNSNETMKRGTYSIEILDEFPVNLYNGTKSIVFVKRSFLGGRNLFLGVLYFVVSGVCLLIAGLFTAANTIKPRKLGDHTLLSWNKEQPKSRASVHPDPSIGTSSALPSSVGADRRMA